MTFCCVAGCGRKMDARGFCKRHYYQARNAGTLARTRKLAFTDADRFALYVEVGSGCWQWLGTITEDGYGTFRSRGRLFMAHRWCYEFLRAPVPEGLVLDHLCRTPSCVRPDHLEPVTNRENILRGAQGWLIRGNHCRRGHDMTDPAHVYVRPDGNGRFCRTCNRDRGRGVA
jgi:hypothetical protein